MVTLGLAIFTFVFELAFQLSYSFSIESALILTVFAGFFANEVDSWMEKKRIISKEAEEDLPSRSEREDHLIEDTT